MSCRLIWSQRTQRVYRGRSAGRVRVFLTESERTSPRIVSLLCVLLPLYLRLPLFPSLVSSLPRSSQIAISLAGLSSDRAALRDMFRCTRSGISARVTPLACAYLLSCGSRRCERVDASTAVRCSRLMSPRQLRARVCHIDSIRHGSQRVSHAAPSSAPIFLSFNRLLRILSLDRVGYRSI